MAARPSPERRSRRPHDHRADQRPDAVTLATISQYLFVVGAITLLLAFIATVAATTLRAVGRRATQPVVASDGLRLAGATAAVGGPGPGTVTVDTDTVGARVPGATADGIGHGLLWASLIMLASSMAIRAAIVGRGPWGNMYEFSIAFATGIILAFLLLERRYPIRSIAFVPTAIALALVGYALTLPSTIEPLVPALQNPPLLTIHVAMAMISYGIFTISFAAAVAYLAQGSDDRFAWLPSRKVLDEVAYRSVIVGFPIFATMIVLGSYWASIAWGRYWGWDPKETAALVTWLIYAVYLHARNQRGWAGRPSALILVIGFAAVLFTYFGNLFFSGLHSYSGL
jgi:cytochrome c-type biogenesis protein CcsB